MALDSCEDILSTGSVLLDVGGGNGTFCALACKRYENLRAINLELAPMQVIVEKNLDAMEISNKVEFAAGSYLEQMEGSPDVVAVVNTLSFEGTEAKKTVLANCFQALAAGGKLILVEAMIDDEK